MGIRERKLREKKLRTHGILEAARKIFEEKGFLNTTLQDVARSAEISVGLIYRYFESKEDIFASLALTGAEKLDRKLELILKAKVPLVRGNASVTAVSNTLRLIADAFFEFYGVYGEYFDMLLYSVQGRKDVRLSGMTLTRLMSRTLQSLDRMKEFILQSKAFTAQTEDEALQITFLFWATLMGCHKVFDTQGRGHLFAFQRSEFMDNAIRHIVTGVARPYVAPPEKKAARSSRPIATA